MAEPIDPLTHLHQFVTEERLVDIEWYSWMLKLVEKIKDLERRIEILEP